MFEVIQWLLTHCCSNTPTLYFKTMFSLKYQLRFYSKRLFMLCYAKVGGGGVARAFQVGLAILQSFFWYMMVNMMCIITFVCVFLQNERMLIVVVRLLWLWLSLLSLCFSLQGCSWSVIFVDLDAHNRNRQTLCSLLPRESRSHVSPFICATTKICLQMTGSLPLDHTWQLGQRLYTSEYEAAVTLLALFPNVPLLW